VALLNLGILAHVDAGKTSLTERLLHDAGVIDEIGSVDAGSTQTDSLALERQRGITIKSAVVSFAIGDVTVNLIDTPGHPDFIAEVERVLSVLDGAVLVLSAVEGVQPQTRVLMRALRRLRLPTLLFVNKIDRGGADPDRVVEAIAAKLTPAVVPMTAVRDAGSRAAATVPDPTLPARLLSQLSTSDDALLAAYVEHGTVPPGQVRACLEAQTRQARVYPVFFGSAITGSGMAELTDGIATLLPPAGGDPDGPLSGTVFKVERGPAGEKIAYARVFDGTLHVRDRLAGDRKVTGIGVFERGGVEPRPSVHSGQIGKLWGLREVRVGDPIGVPRRGPAEHFAPPTLETVVEPAQGQRRSLRAALSQLAEQDPLIDLRQDDVRQELHVSLYGEVQKEVIQATLADEYGLSVTFRETTTICVERPAGIGAAYELMGEGNPFLATVGLRVSPAPVGSGVEFRLEVELGSMPYAFFRTVEDTVRTTLGQGLYGWQVVDCVVTMTHSGYAPRQSHAHQGFDKSMSSTGADFRGMTPLVLMAALRRAGTRVQEPIARFHLELPADTIGPVSAVLAAHRAVPLTSTVDGGTCVLAGEVPMARLHGLERALPSPTRGEGVLEAGFDSYRAVTGPPPSRPRTDANPLDRKEYLLRVTRRV
jgi:ribosomal protection tetracycline resistance protein